MKASKTIKAKLQKLPKTPLRLRYAEVLRLREMIQSLSSKAVSDRPRISR